MAYDERLADRVRDALGVRPDLEERKMFGGLAFMLRGNMCCGVVGNELMVRVGPDAHADALKHAHAREMDFTGRPMKGMVFVAPDGYRARRSLETWVKRGVAFASSLEPKAAKTRKRG